ncbi:MAG: hypothetical protein QM695_12825 [Micropruina sp.]
MARRGEVLRFELPPSTVVADLAGPATGIQRLVGRPPVESTATVIDTPDRRLLSWGLELSREVETGRWTLRASGWKPVLPAERTMPQAEEDVPSELAVLLVPFRRGGILGPVLEVATVRRRFSLVGGAGGTLGELIDERVRLEQYQGRLQAFRTVTLSTPGPVEPGVRSAVVAAFEAAGGTLVDRTPALADRLQLAGYRPDGGAASPRMPIEVFVRDRLHAHWRGLLRADLIVRTTDGTDAELRDGVRALRAELDALGALFAADWLAGAERQLDAALADPRPLQRTERWLRILDLVAQGVTEPPRPQVAGRITGPVLAQEIEAVVRTMRDQCHTLDRYSDDLRWARADQTARRALTLARLSRGVFGKPAKRLSRRLAAIATPLDTTVRPDPAALARDLHGLTATEIFEAGRGYERTMLAVDYARERFIREWPELWHKLRTRVIRPRVPHDRTGPAEPMANDLPTREPLRPMTESLVPTTESLVPTTESLVPTEGRAR